MNDLIGVFRIEVIGQEREYVRYLKPDEKISYSLQDDGRTIKFFIEKQRQEDE